jgi:hypothetical protein
MAVAKVWIVSVDEPLFYGNLYSQLVAACPEHIAGVIIVRNPDSGSLPRLLGEVAYRLKFWGIKGFVYAVGAAFVSRVSGRGSLARSCRKYGIPVSREEGTGEAGHILKRHDAEVVLCSVPRRVSKESLACVPGGWKNTHCGPLPDYKGLDAPFWCLRNGEPKLSVTLHYMAEDFDTGPIIAQGHIANSGEPYFRLVRKLFDMALDLHVEFVRTGRPAFAEAAPQDASKGRYFGRPDAALGQEFRRRGGRFI